MEEIVINLKDKKQYTITAERHGENAQVCPVCSHERKKSKAKTFSYNAEKEVGHCVHCGVTLVRKRELPPKFQKVEYKKPVWKNNTSLNADIVKWFEGRGILQPVLEKMKISQGAEWMPQVSENRQTIQFNYFREGELINVKYRDSQKNFKLSAGSELIFYNLDSIKDAKEIVIVEGEIDCLSYIQAGIENVVSVPNGATLNRQNLTYLDNCIDYFPDDAKIYLALDNDAAGNALRDELARRLGTERCYKVYFNDCKDANESLVRYGIHSLIKSLSDAKEYPLTGIFTASQLNEEIDDYYLNGLPQGIGIGIRDFDELLKFHLGYITTITGIPSHGKSEVLDFIMTKLNINGGWKFGIYSPENYPLQLHFSKFAEKLIGKPFSGLGRMLPMELNLAKLHFEDNFFFIKPEQDFSLDNILDSVRKLIKRKGINAFVIDAWNKLDHQYSQNETQYISKCLDKISLFCEVNNVHCFLVAHPTKIQKDKTTGKFEVPNLYSISGSANFYNKTANGMTVYRDFETGKTHVYIQKVKFKHWGQIGSVEWFWNKQNGRYYYVNEDNTNWLVQNKQEAITFTPNHEFDNEPPKQVGLAESWANGELL